MPDFFVWTPADFGTVSFSTSGTFTMTGTPDIASVTDDDPLLSDGPTDPTAPQDTGTPQTLTTDLVLDGVVVGTAGEEIFNAAEAVVTNNTTGETGLLIYLTVGDSGSGIGFEGYASTIMINAGDEFTISNLDVLEEEPYANLVICFANGTLIKTIDGEKPVDQLQVGDKVITRDNGPQPIRWIGRRRFSALDLAKNEKLRPIRIKAAALADNVPEHDLVVSPQHRIFVKSVISERMFETDEILVPAKHLLDLDGVEIAGDLPSVTYFHIMCDDHEIISANGAYAETLYTGAQAVNALSPDGKKEIEDIFGELPYLDRPLARPVPKGRLARKLVQRHKQNSKDLVTHV